MDFSENDNCKYGKEVQSAHISESLRHDPAAIYAHLEPVFTLTKKQIGKIKTAHFLSDGPSTQYKNKKMFYLIANQIATTLDVEQIQWHFSESGHGKGAPDGIGGAVKRLADAAVGYGKDVCSFREFFSILKEKCQKVIILSTDEADMCKIDQVIPDKLNAFKGTLRIRQIFWHKEHYCFCVILVVPNVLEAVNIIPWE